MRFPSTTILLFLLFCSFSILNAEEKRPNIILVVADNLGYGDIGCFGSKINRTPELDKMAAEGLKLTSFYVGSSVCTPSRSAFMTGCYPARVSMDTSATRRSVLQPTAQKGLAPSEITIAEIVKEQGYATRCIGKWHLGDQLPFLPTRQGFDGWLGVPYSEDMIATTAPRIGEMWPPLPLVRDEKVIEAPVDPNTLTKRYTEDAIQFIKEKKDEPFFLYLPHACPGSSTTAFASEEFRKRSKSGIYGACIEELDWSMGEIFRCLKEQGLDENTIVVWTSDNGAFQNRREEPFGQNTPLRGTGGQPFEGGFRAPCIVRWPGRIPAGSMSNELVTSMDLLPTFAKLTGGSLPQDRIIDGHDVMPLLAGKKGAKSPTEVFYYYHSTQLKAVRSGKWKLHLPVNVRAFRPHARSIFAEEQLFDLEADMEEKNDLADANPDIVKRLTALAQTGREKLGDVGVPGIEQRPAGWMDSVTSLRVAGLPSNRGFPSDAIPLVTTGLGLSVFDETSQKGWGATSSVALDKEDSKLLYISDKPGDGVLHNTSTDIPKKERAALRTARNYGDIELHVEFLMAKGSNSGVYILDRYEVQILDSWGKPDSELAVHDCGAIYERWSDEEPDPKKRGYEGTAPKKNATRPPGEWQSLDIVFRAPRFDKKGNKTTDATFVSVELNGVLLHKNVTATGPTRGGKAGKEAAKGPLVFQGNHGPVGLRNVWVKELE